ncbi:MAG: three-Cys-motif partner protein TcmP [Candidatus Thermoplasmatota archaeon]|nr:three-Cys-motif partner protein TcmP [Candidatus Thermoplasmatota archaeon]
MDITRLRKWRFLEYYLSIYTTIITKNFEKCIYIDGLAGQGTYEIEPFGEIDGSSLRALKLKFPFTDYYFIEKNHFSKLKNNINEYVSTAEGLKTRCRPYGSSELEEKKVNITPIEGDVNIELSKVFSKISDSYPCFTFLDPEGIKEIPWESSIKPCLKRNKTELLVYFSLMGVSRCFDDDKSIESMNSFFGGNEWQDYVDKNNVQESLLDLYKLKLNEARDWVLSTPPMTNIKNSPIYCLIFSTNNDTAFRIWNNDVLPRVPKIWEEKDLDEWMRKSKQQMTLRSFR